VFGATGLLFFGLLLALLQAQRKLRFAQNLFEKGIGFRRNPVLLLNPKGQVVQANFRARQLLDLNTASWPLNPKALPDVWASFRKFLLNLPYEEPIRQEIQFEQKFSGEHFRAVAEPVSYPKKRLPYWIVFLLNTSTETALENAHAWAAMAQRIAHDIKNPLTSILLTQQRLEMEYKRQNPEKAHLYEPYTRRILNRIEALRRMTRDFMKFVNVEKINPQPTDINALITNFISSDLIEWPSDIQLKTDLSPNLPPVLVDQEQVQTLLENLLSNAINAMPNGGAITIETNVALNLRFPNENGIAQNYVALEILDTGKGIPAHLREKIFRPFTTSTHLGTGLGLTIVKKIVDDHKGHIEINSEEGIGTSIIVYFPVA
jgi:signal transduction histidine kinase